MWTNLIVKNYRGPSLRVSPKLLRVLPSRTWTDSHSKRWRKTSSAFLQRRGKRNHFELHQSTAVLSKADQGIRGNQLTRANVLRSYHEPNWTWGTGILNSIPSCPIKAWRKILVKFKVQRHRLTKRLSPKDKTRLWNHLFPHLTAILPKAHLQKFLLTGTSGPVIKKKKLQGILNTHTHTLSLKRQIKCVEHKTMKS